MTTFNKESMSQNKITTSPPDSKFILVKIYMHRAAAVYEVVKAKDKKVFKKHLIKYATW